MNFDSSDLARDRVKTARLLVEAFGLTEARALELVPTTPGTYRVRTDPTADRQPIEERITRALASGEFVLTMGEFWKLRVALER